MSRWGSAFIAKKPRKSQVASFVGPPAHHSSRTQIARESRWSLVPPSARAKTRWLARTDLPAPSSLMQICQMRGASTTFANFAQKLTAKLLHRSTLWRGRLCLRGAARTGVAAKWPRVCSPLHTTFQSRDEHGGGRKGFSFFRLRGGSASFIADV